MNTLNKIVLRTCIEGLVSTIIAFCYGLAVFAIISPSSMANFYDEIGDKKLSAIYYGRVYERTGKDTDLYMAFEKATQAKNDGKTIKYGVKFFNLSNHIELTDAVDDYLRQRYEQEYGTSVEIEFDTDKRLRYALIAALERRNLDADEYKD